MKPASQRPGVVTLITVLAITGVAMAAFLTLTTLGTNQLSQVGSTGTSEQALYGAESGLNLALLRLATDATLTPTPLTTTINGINVSYSIDSYTGNPPAPEDRYKRVVTSTGTAPTGAIRKVQTVVVTNSFSGGVNYAAQAGAGGIQLDNTSHIIGDVFSNTNISPIGGGGAGSIIALNATYPGNAWAVGTIDSADMAGEAHATTLTALTAGSFAFYQNKTGSLKAAGGAETCQNALDPAKPHCKYQTESAPTAKDLAIRDDAGFSHVQNWINEINDSSPLTATAGGGCPVKTYCVPAGGVPLGKRQIGTSANPVDLFVGNGKTLTLTANIYVTGKVITDNNASVIVAGAGPGSVVVISEGLNDIDNGSVLRGSTNAFSFLIFVSRSTNNDPDMSGNTCRAAICASNNSNSVIFATPKGMVRVKNNGHLRATVGDSIYISNSADVTFNPNISGLYVPSQNPTPIGIDPTHRWKEL